MKPVLLTLFINVVFFGGSMAQASADTTTSFTLDNCIRYALENTVDVKNDRIDQQIAHRKGKRNNGTWLPQISGSCNGSA